MKSDDFIDLARVTFLTNLPAGAPVPLEAHIQVLAKLLCAAASGRGALEIGKLNLTPD